VLENVYDTLIVPNATAAGTTHIWPSPGDDGQRKVVDVPLRRREVRRRSDFGAADGRVLLKRIIDGKLANAFAWNR